MNGHKTFHDQYTINLQRNLPLEIIDKFLLVLSKLDTITNYISEYIFYTFLTNNYYGFHASVKKYLVFIMKLNGH